MVTTECGADEPVGNTVLVYNVAASVSGGQEMRTVIIHRNGMSRPDEICS
jgi:hypothetical protein